MGMYCGASLGLGPFYIVEAACIGFSLLDSEVSRYAVLIDSGPIVLPQATNWAQRVSHIDCNSMKGPSYMWAHMLDDGSFMYSIMAHLCADIALDHKNWRCIQIAGIRW